MQWQELEGHRHMCFCYSQPVVNFICKIFIAPLITDLNLNELLTLKALSEYVRSLTY